MKYSQGDKILIPYPFTDLSNTKQRPAVIISKDSVNKQNYIVAKITSVIRGDRFSFPISPADIDRELKYESEVRTNEVFTISQNLIIKKFGSFKKEPIKRLTESIKDNISVEK
ncbi:MAG: type II toxin-antitoxin system PemK/MazF family toxin [Bacteroidia bacterium]|nr:type II toxin-antitoxin system PemK/MazF family toxin [Bacteroidia bacterium]